MGRAHSLISTGAGGQGQANLLRGGAVNAVLCALKRKLGGFSMMSFLWLRAAWAEFRATGRLSRIPLSALRVSNPRLTENERKYALELQRQYAD